MSMLKYMELSHRSSTESEILLGVTKDGNGTYGIYGETFFDRTSHPIWITE